MIPATKDKTKLDVLKNSEENATINTDTPIVREEQAQEGDINYLIEKYGYGALLNRPQPVYADFDYTLTLQDHYEAAAKITAAYDGLPEHIRERYAREEFFARLAAGEELDMSDKTPEIPKSDPDHKE